MNIYLHTARTALPGPAISNDQLTRRFGMPVSWRQWIDAFVGTRSRHFSVDLDTGEVLHTVADLGTLAADRALQSAGLQPGDIDLMIMGTSSPDALMPTTVNVIADRLGIDRIPAYQLQSGCTGGVQALDLAYRLMRSGTGYRHALVLGADSCAKHFDLTVDPAKLPPAEQINGVLFGDGAGAAVLSVEPAPDSAVIREVLIEMAGLGRAPGQVIEWFGRADRDSGRTPAYEDYKAIEGAVPVLAVETLDDLLDRLDWKPSDIDYLLPPQLSGRMTERITAGFNLPMAHEVSCVADTGNTGNALPFFQLELTLPRMITGDRAVAVAIESSKWIKAGFAVERI